MCRFFFGVEGFLDGVVVLESGGVWCYMSLYYIVSDIYLVLQLVELFSFKLTANMQALQYALCL